MRGYRAFWTTVTVAVTGVAGAVAWLVEGPWLLLAEAVTVSAVGAAFGATLEDDPDHRWGAARRWAFRGVVAGLLLTGLPPLLGGWSLLVTAGLAATHPTAVRTALRWCRRGRDPVPEGRLGELSDEQLLRRWRSSTLAVRSSWRTSDEVAAVVREREQLLDEIERRDPAGFPRWLAGGRQAQER